MLLLSILLTGRGIFNDPVAVLLLGSLFGKISVFFVVFLRSVNVSVWDGDPEAKKFTLKKRLIF